MDPVQLLVSLLEGNLGTDLDTGRTPSDYGVRDWSNVSTGQGMPKLKGPSSEDRERQGKDPPLEISESLALPSP